MNTRQFTWPVGGQLAASPSPPVRRRAGEEVDQAIEGVDKKYLTMKQATAILGVKPQTLYAYVSRGLVRTAATAGRTSHLYSRDDVEAVAYRSRKGAPELVAGDRSMRWGAGLVLPTAICELGPEGPKYRGYAAVDLARAQRTFEEVVELLWSGVLPTEVPPWAPPSVNENFRKFASILPAMAASSSSRRLIALLAEAFTATGARNAEFALGAPAVAARQLIQVMVPALGLLRPEPSYELSQTGEPLAIQLARAGGIDPCADARAALDACLVLSAEHGLGTATFAGRIAASAGADIFACVTTALGAFEGLLTGLGCDQAEALLTQAHGPAEYVEALRTRLRRKYPLPGYNSALYPDGDPRADYLLEMAEALGAPSARPLLAKVRAVTDELGAKPGVAIGLVSVCVSLGLPPRGAGAVMAIGRSAGWVAHAFEQRLGGAMVRPRARYLAAISAPAQAHRTINNFPQSS